MRKLILLFIFAIVAINATTPTYENVTRLYVATFDRTPDVVGLKYWVNDSGLELEEIARSFFDQPETKAKYYPDGTIYLGSFVDEVYVNLFDRAPDSVGRAYWIDAMHTGRDHFSTFILAAINGAQGNDAVILADKTKYAMDSIRDELDPGDNYDGNIGGCQPYYADSTSYTVTRGRLSLKCTYYRTGQLSTEAQLADGKRHGIYSSYYISGARKVKWTYWNGTTIEERWYKENGEMYVCSKHNDDGTQTSCM